MNNDIILKLLRLTNERQLVKFVHDQDGRPSHAPQLAYHMIGKLRYYHICIWLLSWRMRT